MGASGVIRCLFVGGSLATAVVACDRPVAPTAPTPPPLITLSGFVVDGADQRVPGALVEIYIGATPMETVTDQSGAYRASFHSADVVHGIHVSRDGYEPSAFYVGAVGHAELKRDLRLHRIWRIPAGQSVMVPIEAHDPICGLDDYWCRTVRVVRRGSGRLRVESRNPDVRLRRSGDYTSPSAQPALELALADGEEAVIDVMTWKPPVTVILHSSVE